MKLAWQIFKKHPISIVCYLIYSAFCYFALSVCFQFHQYNKLHPERSGIANGGEAAGFAAFFTYIFALLFLVAIVITGSIKGDSFYFSLGLGVIIPLIILGNI